MTSYGGATKALPGGFGAGSAFSLPPGLNLALQRLEVPLNPVHAHRECVNQVEALGVLGQDRRE